LNKLSLTNGSCEPEILKRPSESEKLYPGQWHVRMCTESVDDPYAPV